MAAHKHIDAICLTIIALTLLLTFLFINGESLGLQVIASEENSDAMFTANDLDAAWDAAGATMITLADAGSTVRGTGAYADHGSVYIVGAGRYVLTGALSDGSVVIEAENNAKIWLLLDGVSIHCEDAAALRVEQAGKVFLTLPDGSENILSSGEAYSEAAVAAGVDGTIYSKDDLTINGSGSLRVTAAYQHGIVCNDDLVITGGTLEVTAAQDALHANDSVRLKDADLTLSAGDDGITASNDDETAYIYVESGSVTIPSCYEGLEAVQITIAGGTIDIDPTDDGINANGYGGDSVINITGGDITITDDKGWDADGIDSNKDIYISGGRLFVSVSDNGGSCAIDCGSENGGVCEISGGTVLACGSSRMAEGFDESSSQGFLMQTVTAAAGTTVTLKDSDGNELLSEVVPCSFSSVLVSTPAMRVGDTCTLLVGDTATEMTIDNSAAGGFGGFGGRGMPGADGFSGGRLPGQDGFDRNAGAFGEGQAAAAPDNAVVQPDDAAPAGSMQPPEMANGTTEGIQPPEPPQGDMPELPTNGDSSDGVQPRLPQGGRNFGDRPDAGNMREFNGNWPGQADMAQPAAAGTPLSAEELLLLGVSAAVLLAGCVIAACYKRRG